MSDSDLSGEYKEPTKTTVTAYPAVAQIEQAQAATNSRSSNLQAVTAQTLIRESRHAQQKESRGHQDRAASNSDVSDADCQGIDIQQRSFESATSQKIVNDQITDNQNSHSIAAYTLPNPHSYENHYYNQFYQHQQEHQQSHNNIINQEQSQHNNDTNNTSNGQIPAGQNSSVSSQSSETNSQPCQLCGEFPLNYVALSCGHNLCLDCVLAQCKQMSSDQMCCCGVCQAPTKLDEMSKQALQSLLLQSQQQIEQQQEQQQQQMFQQNHMNSKNIQQQQKQQQQQRDRYSNTDIIREEESIASLNESPAVNNKYSNHTNNNTNIRRFNHHHHHNQYHSQEDDNHYQDTQVAPLSYKGTQDTQQSNRNIDKLKYESLQRNNHHTINSNTSKQDTGEDMQQEENAMVRQMPRSNRSNGESQQNQYQGDLDSYHPSEDPQNNINGEDQQIIPDEDTLETRIKQLFGTSQQSNTLHALIQDEVANNYREEQQNQRTSSKEGQQQSSQGELEQQQQDQQLQQQQQQQQSMQQQSQPQQQQQEELTSQMNSGASSSRQVLQNNSNNNISDGGIHNSSYQSDRVEALNIVCSNHPLEEAQLFCCDCQCRCFCTRCITENPSNIHANHTIMNVTESSTQWLPQELSSTLTEITDTNHKMMQAYRGIVNRVKLLQENASETEQTIERLFSEAIEKIITKMYQLKNIYTMKTQQSLSQLQGQQHSLKAASDTLQAIQQQLSQLQGQHIPNQNEQQSISALNYFAECKRIISEIIANTVLEQVPQIVNSQKQLSSLAGIRDALLASTDIIDDITLPREHHKVNSTSNHSKSDKQINSNSHSQVQSVEKNTNGQQNGDNNEKQNSVLELNKLMNNSLFKFKPSLTELQQQSDESALEWQQKKTDFQEYLSQSKGQTPTGLEQLLIGKQINHDSNQTSSRQQYQKPKSFLRKQIDQQQIQQQLSQPQQYQSGQEQLENNSNSRQGNILNEMESMISDNTTINYSSIKQPERQHYYGTSKNQSSYLKNQSNFSHNINNNIDNSSNDKSQIESNYMISSPFASAHKLNNNHINNINKASSNINNINPSEQLFQQQPPPSGAVYESTKKVRTTMNSDDILEGKILSSRERQKQSLETEIDKISSNLCELQANIILNSQVSANNVYSPIRLSKQIIQRNVNSINNTNNNNVVVGSNTVRSTGNIQNLNNLSIAQKAVVDSIAGNSKVLLMLKKQQLSSSSGFQKLFNAIQKSNIEKIAQQGQQQFKQQNHQEEFQQQHQSQQIPQSGMSVSTGGYFSVEGIHHQSSISQSSVLDSIKLKSPQSLKFSDQLSSGSARKHIAGTQSTKNNRLSLGNQLPQTNKKHLRRNVGVTIVNNINKSCSNIMTIQPSQSFKATNSYLNTATSPAGQQITSSSVQNALQLMSEQKRAHRQRLSEFRLSSTSNSSHTYLLTDTLNSSIIPPQQLQQQQQQQQQQHHFRAKTQLLFHSQQQQQQQQHQQISPFRASSQQFFSSNNPSQGIRTSGMHKNYHSLSTVVLSPSSGKTSPPASSLLASISQHKHSHSSNALLNSSQLTTSNSLMNYQTNYNPHSQIRLKTNSSVFKNSPQKTHSGYFARATTEPSFNSKNILGSLDKQSQIDFVLNANNSNGFQNLASPSSSYTPFLKQ